jgi:thymidylate kinase
MITKAVVAYIEELAMLVAARNAAGGSLPEDEEVQFLDRLDLMWYKGMADVEDRERLLCDRFAEVELLYLGLILASMTAKLDAAKAEHHTSMTKVWDTMSAEQQAHVQNFVDEVYSPDGMIMFDCAVEIGSSKMPRRRVPTCRKYKENNDAIQYADKL